MRKIKFRGIPVDENNNDFVEGYYAQLGVNDDVEHYIIQNWSEAGVFKKSEDNKYFGDVLVDPETVEQYIGRKDKNNREIFEGDIVRFDKLGREILGVIVWQNNFSRFAIKHKDENNDDYFTEISHYLNIEIIGNVFDNCRITEGEIKCLHG